MIKKTRWTLLLLLPLLCVGCFRQDVVTIDIAIPQMRSQPCAERIIQSLGRLEQGAIVGLETDLENGVLSVTYNAMRLAKKNIEYAITDAGFEANGEAADAEARQALPEECR
jgi:copper chaperone CopZ